MVTTYDSSKFLHGECTKSHPESYPMLLAILTAEEWWEEVAQAGGRGCGQ